MRITTLNLQQFVDWEVREPAIIEYLQSTSPDVILFQEVVYLPKIAAFNQVQLLNQTLKYPSIQSAITRLQPSTQHEVYREGVAALSNYTVVQADTIILKQASGDEHNRIVQLLDIDMDGEIVKIANVHFSITDFVDFATAHLAETLEILEQRQEERIIVGDFNLSSLKESAYLWEEKYICSDQQDYITYPDMDKRIDYFLIPKSYSFSNISVSGDGLSDHRALTVDIERTKQQ